MDDLQLKVSSSDRYIVRRNGDLGLGPVVRRIRSGPNDVRFVTWTGADDSLVSPFFREWLQSQASDWMSGGLRKHMRDKQVFQETV